jgi:hypothetical protein
MIVIKAFKNKKGEINYRRIGQNGETLSYTGQGFRSRAGLIKNLRAHYGGNVSVRIQWLKSAKTKTIVKEETIVT